MNKYQELIKKYNLPELRNQSKLEWKRLVQNTLKEYNKTTLLTKIKKYKKLDYKELVKEKFQTKPYLKNLNLADARLRFALRTRMTMTVQANYKGDQTFKSNGWKCQECQVLDTQEHVVRCLIYISLRNGKDLSSDRDIVEYFRRVIDSRKKE